MNALQAICGASLGILLAGTPGDRPPADGRVVAGRAAAAPIGVSRVPPFVLFGWVSPPVESTTAARVAEMSALGFNVALSSFAPDGELAVSTAQNLARLDAYRPFGIRGIFPDSALGALLEIDPLSPAGRALIDSVVTLYEGRAELLGWSLGDEPPAAQFDLLARIRDALAERDPERLPWNNLLGRGAFATRAEWIAYLRGYVARVRPVLLCDAHYDFEIAGDRGQFVENAAGLAAAAREAGVPFWSIVQVTPHGTYRPISPGILAWQVAHLLAHGARGVGYFTYWTPTDGGFQWGPGLIARDGSRGPLYPAAAALAPRLRAAGETLAGAAWLATEYAGSVPPGGTAFAPDDWVAAVEGRAALGHFVDPSGARLLLVANSDSSLARSLTLVLPHAERVEALGDTAGAWTPLAPAPADGGARVTLALEAGDFALLRVRGDFGTLRSGRGPALRSWPSPARGAARLSYAGLAAGGRLEVLDASGRRVWSAAPPEGDGLVTWDGRGEDGAAVPPGIYFARLEDARGAATARVAWLGAR